MVRARRPFRGARRTKMRLAHFERRRPSAWAGGARAGTLQAPAPGRPPARSPPPSIKSPDKQPRQTKRSTCKTASNTVPRRWGVMLRGGVFERWIPGSGILPTVPGSGILPMGAWQRNPINGFLAVESDAWVFSSGLQPMDPWQRNPIGFRCQEPIGWTPPPGTNSSDSIARNPLIGFRCQEPIGRIPEPGTHRPDSVARNPLVGFH